MKPALFLDRDGVINHDEGYTHRIEDFRLLPGVPEALRLFQSQGYLLVVVTNQAGIARGYFDEAQFSLLTSHMKAELSARGVRIDAVYHCPHHPAGSRLEYAVSCQCRKPEPGMLLAAAQDLDIDLRSSWLLGDKESDIQAGLAAGLEPARCLRVPSNAGVLALLPGLRSSLVVSS